MAREGAGGAGAWAGRGDRDGEVGLRIPDRATLVDRATAAGEDQLAGGGCAPAGYCGVENGLLRPAVIPLAPRTGKAEARKGKNVSAQPQLVSSWRREFVWG